MTRKFAFLGLLLLIGGFPAQSQTLTVEITSPVDGSSVGERPYVEGSVSSRQAAVWVVVRPMESSDYWVQPRVTVRSDGGWKVKIYVGRPGAVDVGKDFEVRAVANPRRKLTEGQVLDDWPASEAISNVVEVVRKESG